MLTEGRISKLPRPPAGRRLEVADTCLPGLVLRVTDRGIKTFCVRYRVGSRSVRFTLGKQHQLDLRRARKAALKLLADVAGGADPMTQKRQLRTARQTDSSLTVEQAVHLFVDEWLPQRVAEGAVKPAYAVESARLLRKEVATRWKGKAFDAFTARDLSKLLDDITAKSTRRHTYFALRAMCKWAAGSGLIESNPMPTSYPNPSRPKNRERVLSLQEVGRLWHQLQSSASAFDAIVALLLLTGQRRDEVADAEWSEFDFSALLWTIPGARTKNGRAQQVPLTPAMITLIERLPSRNNRYLFPGKGATRATFSGWSRSKSRLNSHANLTDWTLHDLRRTIATHLSERGVQPQIVERLLNHSTGVVSGVSAIYNRATYLHEIREALDYWSALVVSSSRTPDRAQP